MMTKIKKIKKNKRFLSEYSLALEARVFFSLIYYCNISEPFNYFN
jgi:hypothetical protein